MTTTDEQRTLWCPECEGDGEVPPIAEDYDWSDCSMCKVKGEVPIEVAVALHEDALFNLFATGGQYDDHPWRPHPEWPAPVAVDRVAFVGETIEESDPGYVPWQYLLFHIRCVDGNEYDAKIVAPWSGSSELVPDPCSDSTHRPPDWPAEPTPIAEADRVHVGPRDQCGCDFAHVWDEERSVGEGGNVYLRSVYAIGEYVQCEHGLFALAPTSQGDPHEHLRANYCADHAGAFVNETTGERVDEFTGTNDRHR